MEDKLKNYKPLEDLLDSVRDIEGFPIGEDKDILALSDTPYYTACPNPYINDFIEAYGTPYDEETDTYERKPYVGDVSEGKESKLYRAHSYHTKVPPAAIAEYIKHYTKESDIVFDGFSGSGMTGVAAQRIKRNVILSDISPIAMFISKNYNFYSENFYKEVDEINKILEEVKKDYGWVYSSKEGEINYTIWSQVFICPYCSQEYIFWDEAVDKENESVRDEFKCLNCQSEITKKISKPAKIKYYDTALKKEIEKTKYIPVINDVASGKERKKVRLGEFEQSIIRKIEDLEIPYWYPSKRMPEGDESRRNDKFGMTHTHHFYFKRTLLILSAIYNKINSPFAKFIFTSIVNMRCTKRMPYRPGGRSAGTVNNLNIPSLIQEYNVIDTMKRKMNQIITAFEEEFIKGNAILSTNSITNLQIENNSIDYIFTDPPFGANIMYSELSFLWESWLGLNTNILKEAIINKKQDKGLIDYKDLMLSSFKEYYRVLKPNRWITVEFHNSKAAVWNVIQETITKAGFIIAQVSVLDKKQGSFTQVTSAGAVSKDLVINAYKPKQDFEERFLRSAGEGMEVDFVKQQFQHLPIEPNIERTEQMLYSKMLAHYIENGFKIKYNSSNFFELLESNFVELDGYWFDESEVLMYNEWKSKQGNLDKIKNLAGVGMLLFINDEKTALQWIYQFLNEPRSYSDILTAYNMIVDSKSRDEIPELREMLDKNFFTEDGKYRKPYTREERTQLKKNREKELEKAWEKILERSLVEKKKIKTIRKEALEFGFKKCYDEENYTDILTVAKKLDNSILEENSEIANFVDIAELNTENC